MLRHCLQTYLLQETVDIVINRLYANDAVITPSIDKKIFRKLLVLCSQGMFVHNDVWYTQVDGVAMGSPLAPSLANMFMAHMENELFNKITDDNSKYYPKLYLRYVDDCFVLFNANQNYNDFLHLLNSLHPNLNFTVELGPRVLSFLDDLVEITGNEFKTCIFRKKAHTNVFLNFSAIVPTQWKRSIILGSLHRAKLICSSMYNLLKPKFRIFDICLLRMVIRHVFSMRL